MMTDNAVFSISPHQKQRATVQQTSGSAESGDPVRVIQEPKQIKPRVCTQHPNVTSIKQMESETKARLLYESTSNKSLVFLQLGP